MNNNFSGAYRFSTDSFLRSLSLPDHLMVGIMINASELLGPIGIEKSLSLLFPESATASPVHLVRIACHVHEFSSALPASHWLKAHGYKVGFNLMQVADRQQNEIEALAMQASSYPVDVLYFADSMGSMTPPQVMQVIGWLRRYWHGDLGIHTHDNMGLALQNTLIAMNEGVKWVDSTVTGMGRGPGNARTEELVIEIADRQHIPCNLVPLMALIRRHFKPMQHQYGWGTNPYYYLAGKYGIHPTYIQEMLNDSRYNDEDILAVIEHLRVEGGKKFSLNTLDAARHSYQGEPRGTWCPATLLAGREVLLLGTGPGVATHREAIEQYIRAAHPIVMALNTQSAVASEMIDVRVACHPVRLLADCNMHTKLPHPLITPASMLPSDVLAALAGKKLLDYGLTVQTDHFSFSELHCTLPTSLVIAYALAVATSGNAIRILMAGFDGYEADDPRNVEMNRLLRGYLLTDGHLELIAVTPTRYELPCHSIYGIGMEM